MRDLEKNARVLKYFAQRTAEELGVTKLLKLAYLTDLHAREYLGRPITSFAYKFHNHGPFDPQLYGAVEEMDRRRWGRPEKRWFLQGRMKRALVNVGSIPEVGFTPAEEAILDFVHRCYTHLPLPALLKTVYETEPMKVARRNRPVPMDIVDNAAKDSLGYDLETVLEQEREIERGNYMLASDFFNALRAETLAGSASQH
jgi:hypothetical protein